MAAPFEKMPSFCVEFRATLRSGRNEEPSPRDAYGTAAFFGGDARWRAIAPRAPPMRLPLLCVLCVFASLRFQTHAQTPAPKLPQLTDPALKLEVFATYPEVEAPPPSPAHRTAASIAVAPVWRTIEWVSVRPGLFH